MTQESALYTLQTGQNVFLTGSPGTGKTFVINQYIDYLKKHGIESAITAPTGIAASHIGGQTLHSFFGLGIRESLTAYDIENLSEKKPLWDRIKNLKVLIIDEVSMVSPEIFYAIDQILKTFKFSDKPFGGVQVILVGDFFQLPPISRSNPDIRFIFQTTLWTDLNLATCYLTTNHRHRDEILLEILEEIRRGTISEDSMNYFRSRYRKQPEGFNQFTKLYTHNIDVDGINKTELDALDTPVKIFEAHTTGSKQWLDKIFTHSLVLPKLELKLGALVFFIKNNYEKGYINGTLGEIVDFDTFGIPIVETHGGKRIKAERMEWVFEDKNGKPKATIKQIPLRLAWAITIHKSQGMTLDAAEIDLSRAFEPGQGYVALSRIKSLSGLRLMGLGSMALTVDPQVLQSDKKMRVHSDEIYHSFDQLSDTEKQEKIHHYMTYLGGSITKGIEQQTEAVRKNTQPKITSYLQSKPFFEQKMSIADIAKERDMTEMTIMKHLSDIMTDDPEFDITYLQPDSHIIESVEKVVKKIKKRNHGDDVTESGDIKLKSIFTELGEKITYDDIKLALLFLE